MEGVTQATEATPLKGEQGGRSCCSVRSRALWVASIISFAEGYDIGVINGAVILFKDELNLANWQVGIVLCIFPTCVAIFAPMAGSFADWVGRKSAMMLSCVLLVAGGLMMAFATSFEAMTGGRMVAGAGAGVGLTAVTAYLSEVSPAHARGFYGSLEELFVNVGNVAGYLINVALLDVTYGWRIMLGVGCIPAAMVLVALALPYSCSGIAESPRWLSKVGRQDEARAVLLDLLNGDREEVDRAFAAWQEDSKLRGDIAGWGETLAAFCTTHRRVALAGVGTGVMNMFPGIMLMMVASTSLLVGAGMSKLEAMWISVAIGTTKAVVMIIVALFVLDSWGRRPLLLASLAFCVFSACLGGCGAYLALGDTVIIVALCLFVTGYSVGVGPVPWVYMPEVFDNRFRGKGVAMGLSGARCFGATYLFLFPILFPVFGLLGLFIFLVIVNAIGFLYIAALCPETKGKTLEEIEQIFIPRESHKVP